MQSFDQSIFRLCKEGIVSVEEAERNVTNVEEFRMRMRGITSGSAAEMEVAPSAAAATRIQRFGN
jgi:Tfp pilus assembly ATPase PilU